MAYHAGVLLVLEHHLGFDPNSVDVLVGTSAGSIVATMVRLGSSGEDLAAFVVGAPFRREWVDTEPRLRAAMEQPYVRRLRNLVTPPTLGHLAGVVRSIGRARAAAILAGLMNGAADIPWRDLVPGALLAGVGFVILQTAGAWLVQRQLADATRTYGFFGIVLGLLA
jgi:hypothetical protein